MGRLPERIYFQDQKSYVNLNVFIKSFSVSDSSFSVLSVFRRVVDTCREGDGFIQLCRIGARY